MEFYVVDASETNHLVIIERRTTVKQTADNLCAVGCCFVYQQQNNVHKSSSLEVYYQCSVEDTHNNMVLELFCQIISEPCFDILRTQEQLGNAVIFIICICKEPIV